MSTNPCLTPFSHRGIEYQNRCGLSPLTRGRAGADDGVVNEMHEKYYTQRSSGGFLMTEATGISQHGLGWFKAPGIWSTEQVEAWKKVTAAVKQNGKVGKFMCQLWHMGRQGHSDIMGTIPPSASATKMSGDVTVKHHKKKPYETAHEMTVEEIQSTIEDYKKAAKNALAACFDGVQIHSANGYLIDQFLQPCTNLRTDDYGGSLDNRLRFLKEVIEAVVSVVPAEKVWIRFSPNGAFGEMGHANSCETFDAAIQLAAKYKLGYFRRWRIIESLLLLVVL